MRIPFLRKPNKKLIEDNDLLDVMNFDNMSSEVLFRTIRHSLNYFKVGQSTKIWTEQVIIELLYQVYNNKDFDNLTTNRYFLMLFQELKNIQRSKQSKEVLMINGISFNSFILKNLKLSSIYFIGCIFDDSDLSESNFINCEFRGCSFVGTDLSKTRFLKTKLIGCNFVDAITDGTIGL